MELRQTAPNVFNIEGIPDKAKLVRVDSAEAAALAHWCLHRSDLKLADDYLETINRTGDEFTRRALWHAAIVEFLKCFGNSASRFPRLSAKDIYAARPPEAMLNFEFFNGLRDKHIAHDENAYSQCLVVAAINDGKKDYKVEQVISLTDRFGTLGEDHWRNLKSLIATAQRWVEEQYEACRARVAHELEQLPYDQLAALPVPSVTAPTATDASKSR